MGASADEKDAVEVFKSIARPEVKHLAPGVGQIECRTAMDRIAAFPIGGRDHLLEADPSLDIADADFLQLSKQSGAKGGRGPFPIHIGVLVRDRSERVERA